MATRFVPELKLASALAQAPAKFSSLDDPAPSKTPKRARSGNGRMHVSAFTAASTLPFEVQ